MTPVLREPVSAVTALGVSVFNVIVINTVVFCVPSASWWSTQHTQLSSTS